MAVRTQDLIFTLYGDYLLQEGRPVWIGSLIQLLSTLSVGEQAVRSAASRMVRKGWLHNEKCGRHSFYALTPRATGLLTAGARQIFHPPFYQWDGHWYLLTYAFSDDLKQTRHRLRQGLSYLGFGQLAPGSMIAAYDRCADVEALLDELEAHTYVNIFRVQPCADEQNQAMARASWDLSALNEAYLRFLDRFQTTFRRDCQEVDRGVGLDPERSFRRRFWLVHEYRYFPYHDPFLPAELLPDNWLGLEAQQLFQSYQRLLKVPARTYVDQVLAVIP